MLCPSSQDSSSITITITFLFWDLSLSLYEHFNPYVILYTTTRQGILFSLLLVMDDYSSNQFSYIGYVFLLLIDHSQTFHNFLSLLSRTFHIVL